MIKQTGLDATPASFPSEFLSFPSRICVLWSQTAKPRLLLAAGAVAAFPVLFLCWILEYRSILAWQLYPSSGDPETLLYSSGNDSVFPSFPSMVRLFLIGSVFLVTAHQLRTLKAEQVFPCSSWCIHNKLVAPDTLVRKVLLSLVYLQIWKISWCLVTKKKKTCLNKQGLKKEQYSSGFVSLGF